jgi:hypothetical protein
MSLTWVPAAMNKHWIAWAWRMRWVEVRNPDRRIGDDAVAQVELVVPGLRQTDRIAPGQLDQVLVGRHRKSLSGFRRARPTSLLGQRRLASGARVPLGLQDREGFRWSRDS